MVEPAGDLFESPLIAVATTTLLLFAASVSYLIGHTDWKKWGEKAESKPAVAGAAKLSTATVADQKLAASLVFSDDGNFEPVYDDSLLGKYFAPVKIVEIKERIAGKAREARRQTELERRQLLEPLLVFVDRSLSEFGPLTPLANQTGADPAGIWTSANLSEISTWLGASSRKFAEEKHADRQDHLDALERQLGREKERQNRLRGELRALKSGLSFDWLKIEDAQWVWEVVAWTVFGFLANTLISLFKHCRERTYSADEFLLIFPKLVLAPLLSVVVVALWSSGISTAPINYLNLPVFLVFAFSLGFCTEQLYVAVKDITGWFISRFVKVSEDRVAELAKSVPYVFVNPPPAASVPPPANLKQLRERIYSVAKAEFERGTVTLSSSTS